MGAWIETIRPMSITGEPMSHPTWVRGLKLGYGDLSHFDDMSHPTWVRGLKPNAVLQDQQAELSHPTWVRGLKPYNNNGKYQYLCRTLHGCVD